jgi:hypothetical protein
VGLVLALAVLAPGASSAQTAQRRLATIDALRQFPGYFHLQTVLLHGEFTETAGRFALRSDTSQMRVQFSDGAAASSGPVEVRAQLIDIGRLEPGDARASGFTEGRDAADRWPRPGEELFLQVTDVRTVDPGTTTTIRMLALEPWKFVGQRVTLVGNFRGRNLFGDLPDSPAIGRYDFVLRGSEGAVWVTGLRPRGKGFDLDVDRRVDTNRWLSVTGTVEHERGLVRIEAATLEAAVAPDQRPVVAEAEQPKAPPEPVEIIFNSPTDGDTDVPPGSAVRIQFSRGLAEGTVAGRFRARYAGAPDVPESDLPLRTTYDAATRSIEIRFAQPPQRLRTVRVQLLDGLTGFDGGPITPWSLTFSIAP